MATSTISGAIYDIGVYGTSVYDQVNISILVDGVQGVAKNTPSGIYGLGIYGGDVYNVASSVTVVEADSNHVVVSVLAAGAVGQVGTVGEAVVSTTGVEATSAAGNITHLTVNRVPVIGVDATGELGTLVLVCEANIDAASVSGTTIAGTVITVGKALVISTAPAQLDGFIGTGFAIFENEVQIPTGVSATGSTGNVLVSTVIFNYNLFANEYAKNRTVFIDRRSTAKERTVAVS